MRITVLAGGVGGARFALGLREARPDADIRIVANVGDDVWLAGVKVCPDLDSLLYALAGVGDTERGWGRAGESERVAAELTAYGVGWPWFTLGDLDLGTHLARTAMRVNEQNAHLVEIGVFGEVEQSCVVNLQVVVEVRVLLFQRLDVALVCLFVLARIAV